MQAADDFILTAVADACNVEPSRVHSATTLAEIGFDSLSAASLAFQVESRFGVELGQENVVQLYEASSVGDVIGLINGILAVTPGRAAAGPSPA